MTSLYIQSLFVGLLVNLAYGTDLASLCDDLLSRPASYKIQIICDEVSHFLNKLQRENEIGYDWVPSTRISRDTSSAESALHRSALLNSLRVRRGGNYIRFGRSVSSPHAAYLHSFGDRDKRSDGHYVRFGRSIPDVPHEQNEIDEKLTEEKRFMRFGKREDGEVNDKRFMRFGRVPVGDEEKRFMRFGKKDAGMTEGNKRFMRFGKREDADEDSLKEEDEKRFMRFGRGGEDGSSDKRFMRFGKKSVNSDELGALDYESAGKRFMRFGKRTESDVAKRFMRFGKRGDAEQDKRFMRFGKRFMRFGRQPQQSLDNTPLESKDIAEGKRFMRFGKRFHEDGDLKNSIDAVTKDEEKRFMRFGKKSSGPETEFGSDKRFMRFGKREDSS